MFKFYTLFTYRVRQGNVVSNRLISTKISALCWLINKYSPFWPKHFVSKKFSDGLGFNFAILCYCVHKNYQYHQNNFYMDEKIRSLVQDLVKIDTSETSIEAAILVKEFLADHAIDSELNEYKKGHANLIAKIGPKNAEKMVISGHLDIVPYGDPDKWERHPLSGDIIDGYLWGRGSVDMKSGTAALAGTMIELLEVEDQLNHQIVYAATAEEETGLTGAAEIAKSGLMSNTSHVLIAEPTGLQAMTMEKGIIWLDVIAKGKQAHGSRPDLGINAIEGLTELIPKIYNVIPDLEVDPVGKTTMNVGTIQGGSAPNVVPESANMILDIRLTPGISMQDMLDRVEKVVDEMDNEVIYELKNLNGAEAVISPTNTFAEKLRTLTTQYYEKDMPLGGVHYATDGAILVNAAENPEFVIYGPGSTDLLHQTNERLELKQLDLSRKIITQSIKNTSLSQ